MLRETFAALALATIVGCSASGGITPVASTNHDQAEMAAYAATAQYPATARPDEGRRMAAIIDPRANTVEVMNFSDEPMRDVNVWVNGTFVRKVDVIPARGTRTFTAGQFYDSSGRNMATLRATPNRIELQAGERLWGVMTVNSRT